MSSFFSDATKLLITLVAFKKSITKIDYNISEEEAASFKEQTFDEVHFEINGNKIALSVLTA